jgi:hypothetical protein
MNSKLSNEKGYTLFLALLISILFVILATSLLSLTLTGTAKTTVREEIVQSAELSEKGLQHIINEIYHSLQEKLGEEGLTRTQFVEELDGLLENYLCDTGSKIIDKKDNETGQYVACIAEKPESVIDVNGDINDLRKSVQFKSVGIVDDREKELLTTIEIGAKSVPDALKYAIGSHKTCVNGRNCLPGEGNLFLHGAVYVEGDMKVDGDMITTDRGYAYLNGQQWIQSYLPSAKPGPNATTSKLVLGGDVYTFTNRPNYDQHITRSTFNTGYTKRTTLSQAFTDAPELLVREPVREKIEITEQESQFKYGMNDPGVTRINNEIYHNNQQSGRKVFGYYNESYNCGTWLFPRTCTRTADHLTFSGNNTFGQFSTADHLTISSSTRSFGETTIETGMYVGGNLTIGNGNGSYDPSLYDKIRLSGPIFVNGDLTIKGADAEFNTLIYVNGEVTIENTRINGLDVDGKEGSLIIFANKEIKIRNNSVNQDSPSTIRGYFYTDDTLEMFGVGSNIRIEGGISARRIVLNAIRGRASNSNFTGAQSITRTDYFEGRAGQANRPSRLQIIYNPEIVNTYADLKQQEPIIYNIDQPQIIERE